MHTATGSFSFPLAFLQKKDYNMGISLRKAGTVMENQNNGAPRRPNPRRRRRSPMQIFVRQYLPLLVVIVLIVLFIIFVIGSVRRANAKREQERLESLAIESSIQEEKRLLAEKAQELMAEAAVYASCCEFDKALEVLNSFPGNPDDYPDLMNTIIAYENGDSYLVSWNDITNIPVLSFGRLLIDDGGNPFDSPTGSEDRYYNITTTEFTAILEQLYNNDFMLIDLYDLFTTTQADDGSTLIVVKELRLPAGKKPVLLVHAQADGYRNPLVPTENGFATSLTLEDGSTSLGDYDFVPLLESFIEGHPSFSYKGARAIISVTAHNGLFGHPLEDTAAISQLVTALRDNGYIIAGNTYGNAAYGKIKLPEIEDDLAKWEATAVPHLGTTEVLVFAKSSDISTEKTPYDSEKYTALYDAGFRYYMGLCYNNNPWMSITDNSVRIGRLMVTGNNLEQMSAFYVGLFDTTLVMDPNRK